ncbi:heat shock factor protein hsf8 [Quercus suber]|uniref:Heat shock factor protein hsf8 n=1 Tax=Quercus suber TaxID=58331 RepID=A0AAW0M729_QUESU
MKAGAKQMPNCWDHSTLYSSCILLIEQGFRKVDPDRWEFANEGFLRGQKHLLKNISRRKPTHGHSQQQPQQSHGQNSSVGACVEVGKFGLEEEVERLKRDKNVLMQELVRLRQQQQTTDNQLQTMVQRLQGMEQRQQQMMSFLAKAVQSPSFLAQFVQQQNESNRRITEANKKRRLKQEGISESEHSTTTSDGQIIKYRPQMNETMLRQIMKMDANSRLEPFKNNDSLLIADGSSSSDAMDAGSSPSRISGVRLQEVAPMTGQSSYMPSSSRVAPRVSGNGPSAATSEIQSSPRAVTSDKVTTPFPDMSVLVGAQDAPSISIPEADVIMPELSQIPEMMPGSIVDIPEQTYVGLETGKSGFLDPTSLEVNGPIPIDIDNISPDPDIDALLDNSDFWDNFLVQSPVPEDIELNSADGLSKENEAQPDENGWEKSQHVDKLTEQMGLLTSDTKRV